MDVIKTVRIHEIIQYTKGTAYSLRYCYSCQHVLFPNLVIFTGPCGQPSTDLIYVTILAMRFD